MNRRVCVASHPLPERIPSKYKGLSEIQRLPTLLYIAAYGILRAIFLSVLCWAVVVAVQRAWATLAPGPNAGLDAVLVNFVYGGFLGALLGIQLGLWTGVAIGLAAAAMTSIFAFPLKNPDLYRQLMQVVCMVFATVCIVLIAQSYLDAAGNPIMTILIAAFVAFWISRYLALWSISRSLASQ
jgi:hypothetical protein